MDDGQRETERILKSIEKRINHEYAVAIGEIEDELASYFARFEKKDETWRRWVANGERTREEYQKWRVGQMAVGRRWADQKDAIARQLVDTSKTAQGYVRKYSSEIYAENFNFSTYQVERDAGISTPFTLYSKASVERLVRDNPEVAPPVGKKAARDIAEGKAIKWNKQQLQSVMIQGIMQGDSIPKLTTRLATTVGDKDRKASIRNARTISTGTQNAGRVDAYKRAEDNGVDLEQMWIATLDGRTRHSHRWLNGEVRPVGEEFSNGLEYPADPHGDASEIYNCRCSLRGVVKGLQPKARQYRDNTVDGMTYNEWKDAKATSSKITSPDEKSKAAKQNYLDKYANGGIIKQTESEYQHQGRNKDTTINHSYIESGEYRKKFDNITDNPSVNRTIYQQSKEMLNHRSGTNYEDMCWIDSNTGKVVARELDQKEEKKVVYSKATQKAIESAENLIAVHTHPASMPPSVADFNSNYQHGYDTSLILGHDGTVYQYSSKEIVPEKLHDLYTKEYLDKGYSDKEAQLKAIESIMKNYEIECKEIK